jgi:hypothetical protein
VPSLSRKGARRFPPRLYGLAYELIPSPKMSYRRRSARREHESLRRGFGPIAKTAGPPPRRSGTRENAVLHRAVWGDGCDSKKESASICRRSSS